MWKADFSLEQLLLEHGARYDIYSAAYLGDEAGFREKLGEDPKVLDRIHPLAWTENMTALIFYVVAGGNHQILEEMGERELKSSLTAMDC